MVEPRFDIIKVVADSDRGLDELTETRYPKIHQRPIHNTPLQKRRNVECRLGLQHVAGERKTLPGREQTEQREITQAVRLDWG